MVRIGLIILCLGLLMGRAQAAGTTVQQLDDLEREKVLLSKQLEVAKLQGELQQAIRDSGVVSMTGMGNVSDTALSLIKVSGLESDPQAVFLYSGYRIVANKGDAVIPNMVLSTVSASYVVLRDTVSGKEMVLWLSSDDKMATASQGQTP